MLREQLEFRNGNRRFPFEKHRFLDLLRQTWLVQYQSRLESLKFFSRRFLWLMWIMWRRWLSPVFSADSILELPIREHFSLCLFIYIYIYMNSRNVDRKSIGAGITLEGNQIYFRIDSSIESRKRLRRGLFVLWIIDRIEFTIKDDSRILEILWGNNLTPGKLWSANDLHPAGMGRLGYSKSNWKLEPVGCSGEKTYKVPRQNWFSLKPRLLDPPLLLLQHRYACFFLFTYILAFSMEL